MSTLSGLPCLTNDNAHLSCVIVQGMNQHHRHLPTPVLTQSPTHADLPVLPVGMADKIADLKRASKSVNTQKAYQSDWRLWQTWCTSNGLVSIPAHPDTVSAYIADEAPRLKVSTLTRHLATVSKAHKVAGFPSPCQAVGVQDTLAGLRKTYGTARKEAPGLLADGLRATLDILGDDLAGHRDRALLLVGWCAGLRRSEIADMKWGDLLADPDGLVIVLRKSKTDQVGAGRQVGLAREADPTICPVSALAGWRNAVEKLTPGAVEAGAPIFTRVTKWGGQVTGNLSGQAVGFVIERRCRQAGLVVRYQGHSLRKGLVQQATMAGVTDSAVMATTGHQSVAMLRRYQSTAGLVTRSASRGLLS